MLSSRPASGAAIMTRGLRKHYPENVLAVDGLDLEVKAGECFGLLGPNGAGKTTTIEILEGLFDPTGGEVEVLGRRWDDDEHELRQRIGISLQETHLIDKPSVIETLCLFRSFYRHGQEVEDVLRTVPLEDKRDTWYEKLSGGQKQRLALALRGIGLLLASRATNAQTVSGLMNLVTMPMFLLSGVFFSSARFPDVMQPFIRALPLTALNDAMRAVILDGASPSEVATRAAILAIWSLLSFGAAVRIFRWR